MTARQLTLLLVLLIILGLIAAFARSLIMRTVPAGTGTNLPPTSTSTDVPPSGVFCTMDAKLCPDGSYVGRSGPHCDFAMCPSSTNSSTSTTINVKIGQKSGSMGITIMPLEVIEDSRCAVDVQCIQAGTLRVRTAVTTATDPTDATNNQTFTLNLPVALGNKMVTLITVIPDKTSTRDLVPSDYLFVFKIR